MKQIVLLKSNLIAARTPHTIIYWTGNSNTISISSTSYTAQADKINIDGVEYYQLKLDKDLDNMISQKTNVYSSFQSQVTSQNMCITPSINRRGLDRFYMF